MRGHWIEGWLALNVGFFETGEQHFQGLPQKCGLHRRLRALQIPHELLSRLSPSPEASAAKIVATPEPES